MTTYRQCRICGEEHLIKTHFSSLESGGKEYYCRNCLATYHKIYGKNGDTNKWMSDKREGWGYISSKPKVDW